MAKHSPLPWTADKRDPSIWMDAKENVIVGDFGFNEEIDQDFALLAVNSHDDLVKALEELLSMDWCLRNAHVPGVIHAAAALKLARGE